MEFESKRMQFVGAIALMLSAGFVLPAMAADTNRLAALVAADVSRPVRLGGVDGQAYWNRRSIHFMHPPAFDFKKVEGADRYRFTVIDDSLEEHSFTSGSPTADLSPVWMVIPPGFTRLTVEAFDPDGKTLGQCGFRRFWKLAPYEPGAYPDKPYSYTECIKKFYPVLFFHTNTQHFLKHGCPDGYSDLQNIYPAKMNASLIRGMLRYSRMSPENRDAALAVARNAADYTLSISQGKDAPLAHFPPTYWKMENQKSDFASVRYAGQNMTVYPAVMADAYLDLYAAVGDGKYLDAAIAIANTYKRLQLPDGTWYIKYREKDASPVVEGGGKDPVKLTPTVVCMFLENLSRVTGDARWRAVADRAFAYIEAGPLKTWDFGPQFEDTRPSVNYRDLTSCVPMEIALYLLKRFPGDPERMAQVRELARWIEDQFMCWRKPCRANGHGMLSEPWHNFHPVWSPVCSMNGNAFRLFDNWVDVPGVMEKYRWSIMLNVLNAMAMHMYLEMYRIEKDELCLAKAKTLADSIVRVQAMGPDGEIATHWDMGDVAKGVRCLQNWTNCGVWTVLRLEELAMELEKEEVGKR